MTQLITVQTLAITFILVYPFASQLKRDFDDISEINLGKLSRTEHRSFVFVINNAA